MGRFIPGIGYVGGYTPGVIPGGGYISIQRAYERKLRLRLTSNGLTAVNYVDQRATSSGVIQGTPNIVKRAIRSTAGWATMDAFEKSLYDDTYYETLTAWEATIPTDIVTVNEKWVTECYNDWSVSGLDDTLNIAATTTNAVNNIVVKTPISERHTGISHSGFYIKPTGTFETGILINSDALTFIDLIGIEVDSDNLIGNSCFSIEKNTNIDSCIAVNASAIARYGFFYAVGSIVKNNIAINCRRGFYIGYWTTEDTTVKLYNCTAVACIEYGFRLNLYTNRSFTVKNCVAIDTVTADSDFLLAVGNIMDFDHCASSDGTAEGANSVTGITADDFVDYANDDFSLPYDSRLIGAGTEVGIASDVKGKAYGVANEARYAPIGAFIGIQEFSAIRTSAGWTGMTDFEKARYNDITYETLTTWDAAVPIDLEVVNEQHVAECFNDWASGLSDELVIAAHGSTVDNNVMIISASGSGTEGVNRHDGTPDSGFKISKNVTWPGIIKFNDRFIEIRNIEIENLSVLSSGNSYTVEFGYKQSCIINGCILNGGMGVNSPGNLSRISNNLVINGTRNGISLKDYTAGLVYNNTIADCVVGISFLIANNNRSYVINNILYNCTDDTAFLNASINTMSDNATSKSTIDALLGTLTDVVSADFVDSANDNYNLSLESGLHGVGVDVGITSDILSKDYGLSGSTYYVPIGAFRGIQEFTAIRTAVNWATLTEAQKSRYNDTYYIDLETWESTEQRNLVTLNEIAVAEIFTEGALVDYLQIDGWTHDADHYCIIQAAPDHKFDPVAMTGAYTYAGISWVYVPRTNHILYVNNIKVTSPTTNKEIMYTQHEYCEFNNCVFTDIRDSHFGGNGITTINNSLFIPAYVDAAYGAGSPGHATLNNCTIILKDGKGEYNGDIAAYNCVLTNCAMYTETTKIDWNITYLCTGDYNAQNDNGSAAPPGAQSITTLTVDDFTDYAGNDFSLSPSSVLIDAGTDLSSIFTDDIVGTERG